MRIAKWLSVALAPTVFGFSYLAWRTRTSRRQARNVQRLAESNGKRTYRFDYSGDALEPMPDQALREAAFQLTRAEPGGGSAVASHRRDRTQHGAKPGARVVRVRSLARALLSSCWRTSLPAWRAGPVTVRSSRRRSRGKEPDRSTTISIAIPASCTRGPISRRPNCSTRSSPVRLAPRSWWSATRRASTTAEAANRASWLRSAARSGFILSHPSFGALEHAGSPSAYACSPAAPKACSASARRRSIAPSPFHTLVPTARLFGTSGSDPAGLPRRSRRGSISSALGGGGPRASRTPQRAALRGAAHPPGFGALASRREDLDLSGTQVAADGSIRLDPTLAHLLSKGSRTNTRALPGRVAVGARTDRPRAPATRSRT